MDRVYNFAAGPSMLFEDVLSHVQAELMNYNGSGMSVMEMSHRSKVYLEIYDRTEAALRRLMGLNEDWSVLFLQGGASLQFSMVPLNLLNGSGKADYVDSGSFAHKAAEEASRYGDVKIVASSKGDKYTHIPTLDAKQFRADADYFHITTNNTIYGTQYNTLPECGDVPLVADMSSNILGKLYDYSKFSLIYAGAQKNIAPAGLTVVAIRRSLLGKARFGTPVMLDYKIHADNGSMYNTPPCFPIYMAGLVFEHIEKLGGVAAMEKLNVEKAELLYDFIEDSSLYSAVAVKADRSIMNATFTLPNEELTAAFVKEATAHGLVNLKGHRSVGGIRASIYNAMPYEGVQALVGFMKDFEAAHK